MSTIVDTQRLAFILNELRLPAIKQIWPRFAEQADKEAWPATRFLAALAEHEISERDRRRIERHLAEARLPPGKTLDNFDSRRPTSWRCVPATAGSRRVPTSS